MGFLLTPAAEIDLSMYFLGAFRANGQIAQALRGMIDAGHFNAPMVTPMQANLRKRIETACEKVGIGLVVCENGASLPDAGETVTLAVEPFSSSSTRTIERVVEKGGKKKKVSFERTFEKVEQLRLTLIPAVEKVETPTT